MSDHRTIGQKWADAVTEFSGSWPFIGWFIVLCAIWILCNILGIARFDPYPFLFLNWLLTIVSTLQNPLILLSQNRQNDNDREKTEQILKKLDELQKAIELLGKQID